jgi:hypothetical protein
MVVLEFVFDVAEASGVSASMGNCLSVGMSRVDEE